MIKTALTWKIQYNLNFLDRGNTVNLYLIQFLVCGYNNETSHAGCSCTAYQQLAKTKQPLTEKIQRQRSYREFNLPSTCVKSADKEGQTMLIIGRWCGYAKVQRLRKICAANPTAVNLSNLINGICSSRYAQKSE